MHFIDDLMRFIPQNDQEKNDKAVMLAEIKKNPEGILFRDSLLMHMTGSSIILNADKTKTLMASPPSR